MRPYQEKYIENVREIAALSDSYSVSSPDFEQWYTRQLESFQRAEELRRENNELLGEHLFAALDDLHNASDEDIAELEAFAGALMDWSSNLDCGVYTLIHDALLRLYRFRRDRAHIIKELYMLGMGIYYLSRSIQGIGCQTATDLFFRNEMLFTEGASYLKFFEELDDEQTKGYVIRSLANIAICTRNLKRRVAISGRVLQIVQDDYYRALAPSLPWDRFLRSTHQQMSSNRKVLSKGNLNAGELAMVLESCQVVFRPENGAQTPNVRWLWPFYEMEYSCGFADLATTLDRMEQLIDGVPYDQYDVSGLYANIQLPIYYGRLIRDNPSMPHRYEHIKTLSRLYDKMLQTLLSYPITKFTDYYFYAICLVITDYYEVEGVKSYLEISSLLMPRLAGPLYIRSRRVSRILRVFSAAVFHSDSTFFDDIDFIKAVSDPGEKERAVTDFAWNCGMYHDYGLIKMNYDRICRTRELFENEQQIYEMHTVGGHDDLAARASTAAFADVALGHHRWYNGAKGYPASYVRNESKYRQMTDLVAIADRLADSGADELMETVREIQSLEGRRYSPVLTSFLSDSALIDELKEVLEERDRSSYRELYSDINGGNN